jgi:Zn-dependent protease/predicted transcriptional regulator
VRSQIQLGRIFGIRIGLHYSWFLIAFLIIVSLFAQFHITNRDWSQATLLAMSSATAVLFFICLLLHELSHSVFAKSHGIPVREITLFALGGVSQIEKNPQSAKAEFWMAFVGPLSSAVIGVICVALRGVAGGASNPAYAMLSWLGYINFGLAAFNMIPGYPLDGGRILRAALWWKSGDVERATRQAARGGQIVGCLFIALGILQFFSGAGFGGLWIAFIGWFLLQAAGESSLQTSLPGILRNATVAQVMTPDCPTVDGNLNVQNFVDEKLLRTADRCFMVMDNTGLAGLVTPHEVKSLDRARWPYTTVFDIMRPIDQVRTVQPETPLETALQIMSRENVNQLPVVEDGHVEGLLTRARLVSFFHNRFELKP